MSLTGAMVGTLVTNAPVQVSVVPTKVQVPALAISSSDCRERVAHGQPVWYLVPDGVVQYINKRRLYRSAS
jgi:nicotinic acid mononucleotide adenylyltransferase